MQAHQGDLCHLGCHIEWSVGQGQRQGIHQKVMAAIRPELMKLGAGGRGRSGEKRSDPGLVWKVENRSC